jgi:hypothetical protein
MALFIRKRNLTRLAGIALVLILLRLFTSSSSSRETGSEVHEIRQHGVLDFVALGGSALDVQRHKFLQARIGRDERPDILDDWIHDGMWDYWDRFQQP